MDRDRGEFAIGPSVAGVAGDTVFAFDDRSDRLTVLTTSGDLIETIGLRSEAVGRPVALIRQDDGTYLSQSRWTNPSEEVSFHDVHLELGSTVIEHLDPAGDLILLGPEGTAQAVLRVGRRAQPSDR